MTYIKCTSTHDIEGIRLLFFRYPAGDASPLSLGQSSTLFATIIATRLTRHWATSTAKFEWILVQVKLSGMFTVFSICLKYGRILLS